VILKAGMTLDGKIATASGESQWITGEAARRHAHRLRSQVDAVMVGIGTVLKDDPQLTSRLQGRVRQPLRVIVDSTARIPLTARVLSPSLRAGTLVATTELAPKRRVVRLSELGTNVLILSAQNGRVPLRALLTELGRLSVTSLMIEGGSELNASALQEGLVDRTVFYVAPRLLGGQYAKDVIGGRSLRHLAEAVLVEELRVRRIGGDLLVEGKCP
jgi:diaminohydroxyphosphoribosylaminopyrimidine deaminase/5-amino-6-(5-phosphoribosylamino)uracil reductase